jgi:hypothetical protein
MKEHVMIALYPVPVYEKGISRMQNKYADLCIVILVAVIFDPEEIRTRVRPECRPTRVLTEVISLSLRFGANWNCIWAVIKRHFVYTNKFHYKFVCPSHVWMLIEPAFELRWIESFTQDSQHCWRRGGGGAGRNMRLNARNCMRTDKMLAGNRVLLCTDMCVRLHSRVLGTSKYGGNHNTSPPIDFVKNQSESPRIFFVLNCVNIVTWRPKAGILKSE